MKRRNREITIFNLSMLDVMTGALGAAMIIMIVLLTQKIGIESMSCLDLKEELLATSDRLSSTTEELKKTKAELTRYKKKHPETLDRISAITRAIDKTTDRFTGVIKKITEVNKRLFTTPESEEKLAAFKIPHKIVMAVDLSGSMAPENNKYKEDRLPQVKAALKMFIAAMDREHQLDIVYFPAFKDNINSEVCPDFTILPKVPKECLKFELRDEAYDTRSLSCYKYGYFEGKLRAILTEKDKYGFYKKIACLQPYHDTPTITALEFILKAKQYSGAEGIILFSDGQPDSLRKKIMTSAQLLQSIRKMNTADMKIFTVGIGTEFRNQEDTEAVALLKKLAEQNSGFYIGF